MEPSFSQYLISEDVHFQTNIPYYVQKNSDTPNDKT